MLPYMLKNKWVSWVKKQAGAELSQAQFKLGLDLLHQNYLLYLNKLFWIKVIKPSLVRKAVLMHAQISLSLFCKQLQMFICNLQYCWSLCYWFPSVQLWAVYFLFGRIHVAVAFPWSGSIIGNLGQNYAEGVFWKYLLFI